MCVFLSQATDTRVVTVLKFTRAGAGGGGGQETVGSPAGASCLSGGECPGQRLLGGHCNHGYKCSLQNLGLLRKAYGSVCPALSLLCPLYFVFLFYFSL